MKITTTTKKFREGVKLSGKKGDEVRWDSTGHLSVQLLDASGSQPVAARAVSVDIPGEGKVELESDDDGKVFHPDVPFQDYELDLGDGVKVHAPAVANRDEVQERHVPKVTHGFARLVVRNRAGFPLIEATLTLTGPDGASIEVTTDEEGNLEHDEVLVPGTYKIEGDSGRAEVILPAYGDEFVLTRLEGDDA